MVKKAETTPTNGASGPLETLKAVYEFMTKNGLDSVEIAEDGAQIKLVRRKAQPVQVAVPVPVAAGGAAHAAPSAAPAHAAPAAHAPAVPAGTAVKSPMMGIFYRAPTPSSPPFCKEGDVIRPGQVICMIEAMKVFNEIKAEFPCTIVKCLVENGKPVKSGQDLIIVAR
ncbi:MAG TPA: acetyl-CoA carboxylase biotin carboxyl carrier protein [Elusimicrobiota bacterium]|jgi:acetyl-CoA carboxylase biotin carboxyl carrier protein|nr:acetyl-CoA carboxylase biotin carboxyl carrier protein [Elusimicrobiota bacterium]